MASLENIIKQEEVTKMAETRESYRTAVFMTDQHIPYQDDNVKKISLEYIRDTQPNELIFGGDLIDNPGMSVYDPDPNHKRSSQEEIDLAVQYLSEYRQAAPNSKIVLLPGNHDVARLERTKSLNTMGMKSLRANSWKNLILESARHQDIDLGDIEIRDKHYWEEYIIGGDKGMLFCHGDPRMDSRIFGGKTGFRRTAEEHPFEGHIMYGHQHQRKVAKSRHRKRNVHVVAGMLDAEAIKYNHQSTYETGFAIIHYNPQVRPRPAFHVQNAVMAENRTMILDGKEYRA